jgi:hypothetical protein
MERKRNPGTEPKRRTKAMPFQKGQSGNPAGRPRGARNRATILWQTLAEEAGEALARKAIDLAKDGHVGALRICLDRLAPARKAEPVAFELPPIDRPADGAAAAAAVLAAVAAGDLAPSEAVDVARVISIYVRAREAAGFEEHLARLRNAATPRSTPASAAERAEPQAGSW